MYSSRARRLVDTSVGPTTRPALRQRQPQARRIDYRSYVRCCTIGLFTPSSADRIRTMPRLLLPSVECVYNVRFHQRQRLRVLCNRQ